MPAYKICFLDGDDVLAYKFTAQCDDDGRAKVLAHAMKLPGCKRLEVWNDRELICTALVACQLYRRQAQKHLNGI